MIAAPRSILLIAAGLVAAVSVVYFNSGRGAFVFDDHAAILENASIRRLWPLTEALSPPAGGLAVSGRPVVNLSLAFNYAWGGMNPAGYHVVNGVIHALAALVLFGVVRRTWAKRSQVENEATLLAGGVALLWALHPLQTAAVTYVVQRAESLAGLFYLLVLYGFVRATEGMRVPGSEFRVPGLETGDSRVNRRQLGTRNPEPGTPKPEPGPARAGARRWLVLSVGACVLGVATKETLVTAPLVVLLYDRTFVAGSFHAAWSRRRAYYLALAGTWLLLCAWMAGADGRGGTVGFAAGVSPWRYLLTQAEALVLYLKLAVWPHPLVFDYGERLVSGLAEVWPQALSVVALLAGTVVALWRRPTIGFVGAWFFLMLAPTSSIVPIASHTIAEHRMYLPLAAVIVALAVGAQTLLRRRSVGLWLIGLSVGAGALTMARNATYRTEVALWSDTVAKVPTNARAQANLAQALLESGRPAEAATAYETAVQLQPESADLRANLGQVYARLGRSAEAVEQGEAAVRLAPANGIARVNLAEALAQVGRVDEAVAHLAEVRRLQPEAADVAQALADALVQQAQARVRQGRLDDARAAVEEALRVMPGHVEALFTRGNLAAATQDFAPAAEDYRQALALAPDHVGARNNLANVYLVTGRTREAIETYREVLRLRPDDRSVRENLERAEALSGAKR